MSEPHGRGEISVHRLQMATFKLAGRFNPPTYRDARNSVYAYLVRSRAGALLIDTGIGEGNEFIDARFEPRRFPITDALAAFDLEPTDIDVVVNSHLHFDHCGNNRLFAHAEILVQEAELRAARHLGEQYTVPAWFDYEGARLRAVDGDAQIASGITLLSTPGHTPGHQSVLVESAHERWLVAAQVAYTTDEYRRGGDPELQAHAGLHDAYVRSIARLKAIEVDATLFSHDDGTVL